MAAEKVDRKKEELADRLRQLLGADIEFERLSTNDLNKLYHILSNLQQLALVGVNALRMTLQSEGRNLKLSDLVGDKRLLGENGILSKMVGDNGILGLGILPNILRGPVIEEEEEERPRYRRSRKKSPATEGES